MAINNRDCAAGNQKDVVQVNLGAVATGATRTVAIAPYPCTLQSVRAVAYGVSNAMQVAFEKISGAGSSGFPCGISNMVLQNRSLSGVVGFSGLLAPGATILAFAAGDALQIVTSVANGNATELLLEVVLKKTQDIVTHNGDGT